MIDQQARTAGPAEAMLPGWLREQMRIPSFEAADEETVGFRLDPGQGFERHAELAHWPNGELCITIRQRYQPHDDLGFAVSARTTAVTAPEALWRCVNRADLLLSRSWWLEEYRLYKPLWAIEAVVTEPDGLAAIEALAAARASETGIPHYIWSDAQGCRGNVNPPLRGQFYSVTADGRWSLHYQPATYPLEGAPSSPVDHWGRHPVTLARSRLLAGPAAGQQRRTRTGGIPTVHFLGKSRLPGAAAKPAAFHVPFRVTGEDPFEAAAPEPARRPPGVKGTPHIRTIAREIAMTVHDASSTGEQAPSLEGLEVRLAGKAAILARATGQSQAGFVTGHRTDSDGEQLCTVHFPGSLGTIANLPVSMLEEAPPFAAIATSHGDVPSIELAESLLIDTVARHRHRIDIGAPGDPAVDKDRLALAVGLAAACGMEPDELLRQLDPMISKQQELYAKGERAQGKRRAPRVAGIAATGPEPSPAQAARADSPSSSRAPAGRRTAARSSR